MCHHCQPTGTGHCASYCSLCGGFHVGTMCPSPLPDVSDDKWDGVIIDTTGSDYGWTNARNTVCPVCDGRSVRRAELICLRCNNMGWVVEITSSYDQQNLED